MKFFQTIFGFLFLVCFVISFSSVEAEKSRRVKVRLVPKHISLLARSGSEMYARRYSYGRPIPNYTATVNFGRNRRNFKRNRRNGGRTYASGYRNWTPNRNQFGRNNPRVDSTRNNPYRKRREPYTFFKDPRFDSTKQKRLRPQRFNPAQRPFPPKKLNDFEDEYFYPEDPKREHEFENRFQRSKKKRRNPAEYEKFVKKPDLVKFPNSDDKPYKPKVREPPFSYSTFIQHPSRHQDDVENFYEETDFDSVPRPATRNKNKRVKKKTNNSRKKNKDEEYYRPFSFEKEESYPPVYLNSDDYELSVKSTKKANKLKTSNDGSSEDDYITNKNVYSKPRPHVSSVFSASDSDNFYRGSSKVQESSRFNPSYSQTWSNIVETTARPYQYQTENGFQPQQVNQYNYQNRDYSSLSKTKTVTTNTQKATYYSQPDNTYKNYALNNNYVSSQVSTTNAQSPSNYYSNNVYTNQPSPTYSQPVSSSTTYLSDVTVQKSVPIYDNTETFYSFNNNAYVNGQSSKFFEDSQKYSNRLSNTNTYRNPAQKSETDEFIKKHQNLYNNGLSGVPVQGDGYGKENVKKDYDIGYGDFQFDENPSS